VIGLDALAAQDDGPTLWYRQPAAKWTEALPVGNGELGAMVFGGTAKERVQLNIDSLWAGKPEGRDRKGAHVHLAKAREMLFAGQYREAEELVQKEFMSERQVRSHQTLGDLLLEFPGHEEVEDYRRELNLRDGIVTVRYRVNARGLSACCCARRARFSSSMRASAAAIRLGQTVQLSRFPCAIRSLPIFQML
jgi:alpha-L-fucosidase 2